MRIGGPYTITAALSGFQSQVQNSISLTLGVVQDVSFTLALASVAETVTVTGETSPVLQLDANRRVDIGDARRARSAADGDGAHQRHHPPDAAGQRQRHVRRSGRPVEQHHGRWLVFQQRVRTRPGQPGRSYRRRADLARVDRPGRRSASRLTTSARATSSAPT